MANFHDRKRGLVSIVIATYNYSHFICEALEALKNQTYPHKK
ncbi:MAG: glycosyltransferase family 2 protein [Clostridiaceae bacterium]|nr:glycosyltransferase family 2 protein [Clostridiaceae bacterium]